MKNYNVGKNHPKYIDLTGKQIGKLKVIQYVFTKKRGNSNRWLWECLCECGNKCYVRTTILTRENPQTCCKVCSDNRWTQMRILDSFLSLRNRIYRTYERGAKNRNYEFNLTFDQVDSLIKQNCHYCDQNPIENKGDQVYTYGKGVFKRNGIDRLDNSKGYMTENVVPCCDRCNTAKMDTSEKDFYQWVYKVYHNLKQKEKFNDYPEKEYTQVSGNGNPSYEVKI
jgi:hypothetical protein